MSRPLRRARRRLALLAVLYLVQGMPFGFQALALPLYLREAGLSLSMIGFSSLLAAPWLLKAVWAPVVERTGRRKPWLVAMQLALLALCGLAAITPPTESLWWLAAIILAMNAVTATQDVAVDGVAVDLLEPGDLGAGNAVQVGGYKVGMVIAGGILVAASGTISWAGGFAVMAALVAGSLVVVLAWREPPPRPDAAAVRARMGAILAALRDIVRLPGQLWLLAVVATYKLGESMSDAMWKQYALDAWGKKEEVALWLSTYGMGPSILGSALGGLLVIRLGAARAIATAAVVRAVAIVAFAAIALAGIDGHGAIVAASWFEEVAGGALTPAMFAFMMAQVDARIGAAHFTVLASLEVLGKVPGGVLSGVVVDHAGFAACFTLAAILSVAYLPLLAAAQRARGCR